MILEEIVSVIFFGIFIYFWNRYAVPMLIHRVTQANSANNWLVRNEQLIIKGFQGFYWSAFIFIGINYILGN